jgi:hypothetical protein
VLKSGYKTVLLSNLVPMSPLIQSGYETVRLSNLVPKHQIRRAPIWTQISPPLRSIKVSAPNKLGGRGCGGSIAPIIVVPWIRTVRHGYALIRPPLGVTHWKGDAGESVLPLRRTALQLPSMCIQVAEPLATYIGPLARSADYGTQTGHIAVFFSLFVYFETHMF